MDIATLLTEVESALGLDNVAPLTQGGQKLVLTATMSGTPAIAKVILLPIGPNADLTLKRAHREVELLAAVDSDYVVKVLTDAVEIENPPVAVCWVEERLDGEDLATHLTAIWQEDDVWRLICDAAKAIDACHSLEVVHRDLSPGNLRRTTGGRYVLMDPGLARHLEKTALTGSFQPGTRGWRSPEHVPGGEPVPASDVFALGILAYFALTGTYPIDPSGDQADYDRRLLETQAPPVKQLATSISDELAAVVDRCLQRQSARRFIDGAELLSELASLGRCS
ncbi:serine/threonine-protein kinase [Mycobacterium sp. NPDC050041]|uniref:serine/threonine-protein kinase n=1 Tax=Mycobacterium sp. NPDC050041 TaxID=3364293 RepID=UPI003C2E15A2